MDPLTQLNDLHLPDEIGLWPFAYGWILLALILIAVFMVSVFLINKYITRFLRIRSLLSPVTVHENLSIADINIYLKRVCLVYYSREQTAALYGNDWIKFLSCELHDSKKEKFLKLSSGVFDNQFETTAKEISKNWQLAAILWLKHAPISSGARSSSGGQND